MERKKGFSANNSDNEEERERRAGNYKRRQEGKGGFFRRKMAQKPGQIVGGRPGLLFPCGNPGALRRKCSPLAIIHAHFPANIFILSLLSCRRGQRIETREGKTVPISALIGPVVEPRKRLSNFTLVPSLEIF